MCTPVKAFRVANLVASYGPGHAGLLAACRPEGSLVRRGSSWRAVLFSGDDQSEPYDPNGVTHRYSKMCAPLGIDTHLHAMRHFSTTELLGAGVDLRTVAGRLGHGGGGVTTLRIYAAFVAEADRRAAEIQGSRLARPASPPIDRP